MTNYNVYEGGDKTVNDVLQDIATVIGDTITFSGNNQMAYKKYEVINKDGEKSLKVIDSYDMQEMRSMYDEYSDEDEGVHLKGGRRKRTHKRKYYKRKSHKRKSHKRKSHKRKSHKRRR